MTDDYGTDASWDTHVEKLCRKPRTHNDLWGSERQKQQQVGCGAEFELVSGYRNGKHGSQNCGNDGCGNRNQD